MKPYKILLHGSQEIHSTGFLFCFVLFCFVFFVMRRYVSMKTSFVSQCFRTTSPCVYTKLFFNFSDWNSKAEFILDRKRFLLLLLLLLLFCFVLFCFFALSHVRFLRSQFTVYSLTIMTSKNGHATMR